MKTYKVKINSKTYELKWTVRSLMILRLLGESEDAMIQGLNYLFASLPRDSFANVEEMADAMRPDEMESAFGVLGEFVSCTASSNEKKSE